MSPATLHQLDRTARVLTPSIFSFFVVLFAALPFRIPEFGPVAPNVAIMAVFYWGVYRPDRFPIAAAFGLGLWQDILTGAPLGVNALVLLLVYAAVQHQRRLFTGKSFYEVWTVFAIIALATALAVWVLIMLMSSATLNPAPGLFQLVLTVLVYPFATWVFARIHHLVLRDD